jgi:NADPH:quinone reductase-like Zn-dependent oxidoreductase
MIGLHFYMCGSRSNLESLVDLIDEGRLDPVVDSSFPLQEIVKAEDKLATQDHFGKIVLTPRA